MYFVDDRIYFPPISEADIDGLLAVGGDMSVDRVRLAYQMGIFPWYDEEPILWWSPDPRFVLFPEELVIHKNLRRKIRNLDYDFRVDYDFESVMRACQQTERKHEDGTWIQDEMISTYTTLHQEGMAHSASIYIDGQLVAGLYGVRVGQVFCGESMFHSRTDMSKVCLVLYIDHLQSDGVSLIDCQVHTGHLQRMGARYIPRADYLAYLRD